MCPPAVGTINVLKMGGSRTMRPHIADIQGQNCDGIGIYPPTKNTGAKCTSRGTDWSNLRKIEKNRNFPLT